MTKNDARALFGGRDEDVAHALGVTRTAIVHWPPELTQYQQDRVVGAALRLGRIRCREDIASLLDKQKAA